MHLIGHMSVAYLATRSIERPARPTRLAVDRSGLYMCAVAGAVFPDVVDKYFLFGQFTPFGRTVGHSIFVFAAMGLLVGVDRFVHGKTSAALWFWFGYATHFAADVADDFVAGIWHTGYLASSWPLWPVMESDDWYWRLESVALPCRDCYTLLELVLVVGAVLWFRSDFGRRNPDRP